MKKRRILLLTLVALLLVVGIPTSFLLREYRRELVNRELIAAIKANDTHKVLLVLNAGADPNLPSHGGGSTPLSCVVARPFSQSFQILLAHGANIHWNSPEGFTILHSAAGWGSPERVKSLLKAGLDIEVKDNMGATPLIYACEHNEVDTVEALVLLGADVNVRFGKRGFTPLDVANSKSIASRLRQAGAKASKELDAKTATQAVKRQ